jgi:2-hydroxy-3-oxopropionate reductase
MDVVGFVGLGAMGRPMVRRLLDAGIGVIGYNRSPERARALVGAGRRPTRSSRWSPTRRRSRR